jgi:hypothetical protein
MGFPASVGVQDEQVEWNRSQGVVAVAWTWRSCLTIRCFLCRTAKVSYRPSLQAAEESHAKTPWFLGLRWLDTALDFPIGALYSHPKLRQAGALQDTLIAKKRLG